MALGLRYQEFRGLVGIKQGMDQHSGMEKRGESVWLTSVAADLLDAWSQPTVSLFPGQLSIGEDDGTSARWVLFDWLIII